jgi:hypothetical protein
MMNRRDFMTVIGGASAFPLVGVRTALGAESTTSLYLNGLVMVSFEDSILRIGFPKAPGHKATLKIVPVNGTTRTLSLKGRGLIETKSVASGKPRVDLPEAVKMSEIYGDDIKARLEKCPTIIEIPYAAIKSITTSKVTPDRYTFVRADNGEEIDTFRRRQIAETARIELSADSVLKLDGGKTTISLNSLRELVSNYAPDAKDVYPDQYMDHFAHYAQYIDRPPAADFIAVPKRVTGAMNINTPHVGSHFMMYEGLPLCFFVVIGIGLGIGN